MLNKINNTLANVRKNTPLVQAITNYVTINDCANILLSFGASPAMCEARREVEEFVPFIQALYVNVGTLTEEQREAAILAVKKASELGKAIVLDPVACGAIKSKMEISRELLECGKISIIKGNAGEIKSLAGFEGKVRGVDSLDNGENMVEACTYLAKKYNTVVAATGATDIITDGERVCFIENGTEMLTRITGAGCMTGALTAATAGVEEDKFVAAAASLLAMSLAGEKAEKCVDGNLPGTFRVKLIDMIYSIKEEDVLKGGKIRCM